MVIHSTDFQNLFHLVSDRYQRQAQFLVKVDHVYIDQNLIAELRRVYVTQWLKNLLVQNIGLYQQITLGRGILDTMKVNILQLEIDLKIETSVTVSLCLFFSSLILPLLHNHVKNGECPTTGIQ